MQTLAKFRRRILLASVLAFLFPVPAYAGTCSNPTNNEGAITYNKDYHVMQFCNGTTWMSMSGGGGGSSGGLTLISTQTASASASLQFNGANWSSSYNTLFLNCTGLRLSATGNTFDVEIGEGAGPTWETGGTYAVVGQLNTSTGMLNNSLAQVAGTAGSTQLMGYLNSVSSSTLYKAFTWQICQTANAYNTANAGCSSQWSLSWWRGDTNPATGLEILPGAGTITSGQCSLYGMN